MMTQPAPVVQLLLTVQFEPAVQSLNIIDWADLRAEFSETFPVFAQALRAGSMHPDPRVELLEVPFGLPRLQLITEDLAQVIFLQDDRVSVGWQRVTPLSADPEYPGFNATLDRTLSTLTRILKFFEQRATESIAISAAELAYTDAFLMMKDGVQLRRLEDVFNCFRSIDDFKFNRIHLTYQRILLPEEDALSGNVQTTISGLTGTPAGEIISNLQTVIRFDVTGTDVGGLGQTFRTAHGLAHKIYDTLVKPNASAILAVS